MKFAWFHLILLLSLARTGFGGLTVSPHEVTIRKGQSHQLRVWTTEASGKRKDITLNARYQSENKQVAQVTKTGLVRSLDAGETLLEVISGQDKVKVQLKVLPALIDSRPSFVSDVLPVLSRAGCNSGGCHAKPDGQNGFKLSVFAHDPAADFHQLVKADRGRRVFPAAPEESLFLQKATAGIEHEGGQRFKPASPFHKLLVDWVRQGMPYVRTNEPALTNLVLHPQSGIYSTGMVQQVMVQALYEDGTSRDVTALAEFASNEKAMALADEDGIVRIGSATGEVVITARYMGLVDVARFIVPPKKTLPHSVYAALPVSNPIDSLVYARLQALGIRPSETCSDSDFIRRAYLDCAGILPEAEKVTEFLADERPDKRKVLIRQLLGTDAWADFWAVKWGDLIRPNPSRVGVKPVFLLDQWLRESFRANKPYNQFVRELLTAQGSTHQYGPAVLFRDKREPADAGAFTSQIFLGVRMDCAKCHHHPNEKWSQNDYYQLAAFFGQVKRKGQGISAPISGEPEFIWHAPGGEVKHPVTSQVMKPKPPDGPEGEVKKGQDPREVLVDWMFQPENPYAARAIVNRVWSQFFGRGLVDPVDDFRASNPASNEPLLNWLAEEFKASQFDLRKLMATIMESRVYQLSSLPNETNAGDLRNFSRYYRKRLPAETLLDAVNRVTETSESFQGLATGKSAMETWNHKLDSDFLDAFGRPNSSSECPCERDAKPSMVQALHMMNSREIQNKIASKEGRARRLAESKASDEEILRELYLTLFSRPPKAPELASALQAFQQPDASRTVVVEDVMWAMLNSAEFVFNH